MRDVIGVPVLLVATWVVGMFVVDVMIPVTAAGYCIAALCWVVRRKLQHVQAMLSCRDALRDNRTITATDFDRRHSVSGHFHPYRSMSGEHVSPTMRTPRHSTSPSFNELVARQAVQLQQAPSTPTFALPTPGRAMTLGPALLDTVKEAASLVSDGTTPRSVSTVQQHDILAEGISIGDTATGSFRSAVPGSVGVAVDFQPGVDGSKDGTGSFDVRSPSLQRSRAGTALSHATAEALSSDSSDSDSEAKAAPCAEELPITPNSQARPRFDWHAYRNSVRGAVESERAGFGLLQRWVGAGE